jgi:hypothetical protein
MPTRRIEGRILYTSKKPERLDQPRGFETFLFTHHSDGQVTVRAHCMIEEPAPTVMRDVIYAMDAKRQALELHVHLNVADRFIGTGWLRFDGEHVECESYGPALGRLSQRLRVELPFDGFGAHPIVCDGYCLGSKTWQLGQRRSLNMVLPSPDHRGATAPMIAPVKIDAQFLGVEDITVKAGSFRARHFQFIDDGNSGMSGQHPIYDCWVSDDQDAIFLQGGVGGYMMTWYELVELRR